MDVAIYATVQTSGAFVLLTIVADGAGATIMRQEGGGVEKEVRGSAITLSGGTAYLNDYEFPFDTQITYKATVADGTVAVSNPVMVDADNKDWIRCLDAPTRSIPVSVVEFPEKQHKGRVELYDVVGRRLPIAITDVLSGASGGMTLFLDGSDATLMADAMAQGFPMMLHTPPSHGEDRFYFVVQQATWRRVSRLAKQSGRYLDLDVVEVDATRQILGISQTEQYSWGSLALAYTAWADQTGDLERSVAYAFDTWQELVLAGLIIGGG